MRHATLAGLVLVMFLFAFSPKVYYEITGYVYDEHGHPLPFITVMVKGDRHGVLTDSTGYFRIESKVTDPVLVFSGLGYSTAEVRVKDPSRVNRITMRASTNSLQEVVIGYSSGKKGRPRANDEKMTAPKLVMDQAVSGKVAGVQMGGVPGSSPNRGYRPRPSAWNTEGYDEIVENRFLKAGENPLSTFSIDVDAASYSNVRRYLQGGQLPPEGAVRIEEMINYFHYDYPQPKGEDPFSITTEMAACPWNPQHKLMLIGLQGRKVETENLPPANLVFLIDVSGSMQDENKLPLVKRSLRLLVEQLRPADRVAIVVYAGNAGLVLPSTRGSDKERIISAIDRLEAGGSTAGGAGIKLAYQVARDHFAEEGNNRVILCTDGDFNVGESSDDAMVRLVEKERESGVFLTVLGFGMGNYQDAKMQKLADKGNGNHAYIDNFMEARKVLVSEFGGTLFTIAKDVKLQIEFNPARVQGYRLIGYENRLLNKEDFNNDRKDAGELGSGHSVTALYEIIPVGVTSPFLESVDPLKYQSSEQPRLNSGSREWMTVKFRYKAPGGSVSKLIVHPVTDQTDGEGERSANWRFAAAVAEFGMLLRHSEFSQQASYRQAWALAQNALGNDDEGYRSEFLRLIRNAQSLAVARN